MQREGVFREMKLRGHYEEPSEKKTREKAEAIRRPRKLGRKSLMGSRCGSIRLRQVVSMAPS
jgi:small subunit ribosomal protein S21